MARLASGGRHRPGAIAVPGRRQFRPGARAAARRLHRRAAWADQRRLVLARRARRHRSCCGRSAHWYSRTARAPAQAAYGHASRALPRRQVMLALVVLIVLIFSKYVYMASLSSYYTFYLIEKFGVRCRCRSSCCSCSSARRLPARSRRPVRRSFRRQDGDLVLDPGRAAIHAGTALCQPVLDRRS